MSSIGGKNTKPEVLVRKALFAAGYRFRLHRKDLSGSPDVVLPGRKVAIFANGCFWHMHAGCKNAKLPATRAEFWKDKLQGNVERDNRAVETLRAQGWRVLTVWECGTRDVAIAGQLSRLLAKWIEGSDTLGEISAARSQ
jgi:DNA mismatch endonuclease (patch repair protein)